MSKSRQRRRPVIHDNGNGYQRARCRACGTDDLVYVHQLCAIAGGADPHDVFSDLYDVHHRPLDEWLDLDEDVPPAPIKVGDLLVPAIDTPESVEVTVRWDHRKENLRGVADD
ncbi:hypothetical protein [Halorhabdus sp. CUG00001]|uniref:hypothetical protein n=1 Tax=Halorhabdus sp. CUG00001 TaxID=2600297 RepID=UPI00131EC6A8|nr:hypothetical protein [Halorhabdus sp. CUG00001]